MSEVVVSRVFNDNDIANLTYGSAKALVRWLGVSIEELGQVLDGLTEFAKVKA